MAKIPEAEARLFRDTFVCRKCKSKMKISGARVAQGGVKCRNCGYSVLRPIKRK